MFAPEQNIWLAPYNLTTNYTIPGLSPKFPQVHCNSNGTICQVTTDEGTANAAASIMAITLNPTLNLTKTYFMVAGIAGVKPEAASIGSATFARYAIDIDLIHAVTDGDKPANFSSDFWGQGTYGPDLKPGELYGSEIFELNSTLRSAAANLAVTKANISSIDTPALAAFRAMYNTTNYTRARDPPSIYECDTATGDVYWYGQGYQTYVSDWTKLLTNGTGSYCTTQQEDNATINSLQRAAALGLVDYNRVLVMRSTSDFDKAPPGMDFVSFIKSNQGGAFTVSLQALLVAGSPFVNAVTGNWTQWSGGVPAGASNTTTITYRR
ncbi:Uncharacterized protein C285.05 [Taphrina deformans PYCC 5710]|uniref:Uncharacterized protein C285.05 n=1 Tax=Taphrina deformans (strain PYCC 5710 / ATCC 11124 / CBS 356.35 / IMI 108563 / JCM 9778 / NBRC 8474) TaxID=1097556 RepID=R4XAP3_TAPDE|nr:Uncharacterized protein C285.05 [Taphrina deformans PYCC 5710]|eukprot:CCG82914.1 Uncharacterized protein C285.05 [Taphrina deformans PYCC 5710]